MNINYSLYIILRNKIVENPVENVEKALSAVKVFNSQGFFVTSPVNCAFILRAENRPAPEKKK